MIEVGAGNGLNFAHYPDTVTQVLAIEPEDYLRERALVAAAAGQVPIEVRAGLAERLPAQDESFDAGIAFLVLCSVKDPGKALAELFRVIRAGATCASTSTCGLKARRSLGFKLGPTR